MSNQGGWNALLSHPDMSVGCEISGESGTSPKQNSGCGISGEDGTSQGRPSTCIAIRSNSIRMAQADMRCAPLFGLHQGEALANITHPDDSISYPDILSGSLSHTPCIPNLLMAKDFKASVLHVSKFSIALPWIPNNSPQSWIALVIKKLSKHQNLTQFD